MAVGDMTFRSTGQYYALNEFRNQVTHIELVNENGSNYYETVSAADFDVLWIDNTTHQLNLANSVTFNITAGSHITGVNLTAYDSAVSAYRPIVSFQVGTISGNYQFANDGLFTVNALTVTGVDLV